MAYSSTASEGKGTEYLKRETTFTYDDTQGDEWSEQRNANQLEIYVNTVTVGSDSGILLSAGGGLERFGSTSIEFQSTVHYRQHSDYLGTAFDTQNPSEILWTYDSNRDASFDHTATLTITVYPLVDSLVISYTTSGDTEVNLTGEDDWGRDLEKTKLERSLEGVTDITLVGILAENPEAQDAASDTHQQDTSRWIQVADDGGGDDRTRSEFAWDWSLGIFFGSTEYWDGAIDGGVSIANHGNNVSQTRLRKNLAVLRQADNDAYATGNAVPSPAAGVISGTSQGLQEAEAGIKLLAESAVNVQIGMATLGAGGIPRGAPIRVADLPWGRVGARQAAKAIEAGQTSIKVTSRDDAAEVVWRMFSSRGFTNTTGRTGSDVRNILGSKAGTYHWDDVLDAAGNVAGHGADNVHGAMRHVQIHLYPDGDIIRIFFP